jgi:hypothetical protein
VTFPVLLVARDITKWYQTHGFNTEPRWAMLVEVEAKVSKNNCCRNGKNSSSEPMVSTQNLDGPQTRNSVYKFQIILRYRVQEGFERILGLCSETQEV